MTEDIFASLQTLDPEIITGVARRSLGQPALALIDWCVSPLQHEKVVETTGGLFLFRGHGLADGADLPWSAVLKIIQRPGDDCDEPGGMCYWRREMLAYQTGMLADLPEAVRAPRCYGVSEQAQGGWIWLEQVQEMTGPNWSLADFQLAARHLGRFAGSFLVDQTWRDYRYPNWLCASLFRGFYADDDWWAKFINPASARHAWQRPLVQQVFSDAPRAQVLQIWADKWPLIEAYERLPRVLCHNDAHRRNLMPGKNASGQSTLTAIDWGFCGPGALGSDLGQLVGTSLSYFAFDPAHAADLEGAVLEGYQAGLRDAGWLGDERLFRLGYLLSLGLYWGGTLACEIAQLQPGESRVNAEAKYGRPVEDLVPGWTLLAEFALDRADEARVLIRKL